MDYFHVMNGFISKYIKEKKCNFALKDDMIIVS